jgi:hypothetical protein
MFIFSIEIIFFQNSRKISDPDPPLTLRLYPNAEGIVADPDPGSVLFWSLHPDLGSENVYSESL